MDVFDEIQGAHREPELLPSRQRREVSAQAEEILAHARSWTAEVDPILLLICREFAKAPRKDWAAQIQAWHKARTERTEKAVAEFKVLYPPLVPNPEPEPSWLRTGGPDLDSLLDRAYTPLNVCFDLRPMENTMFHWAASRDVNWRWQATWRQITKARFFNGTRSVWGTAGQNWDVKRVNWDEIFRDTRLRWQPLPMFTRDDGGGGEYADVMITERRQA